MIAAVSPFFGRQLATRLEAQGLNETQLAELSGLPQRCLSDLLYGQQILTADVAIALGAVLELSPLYLLDLQRNSYLDARDQTE